jgi:hypothetical protein
VSILQDWSLGAKFLAALITIGATLIGSVMVRAFVTNDSYWVVTRGYLDDFVVPLRKERDDALAQVNSDLTKKLDSLDDQYRDLSENQLANRVGVLEVTILILNQELTQVELRLREKPNDVLALNRHLAILNSIHSAEERRRLILCMLDKGRDSDSAACR